MEYIEMKTILALTSLFLATSAFASFVNVTQLKSCPDGLVVTKTESWANGAMNHALYASFSKGAYLSINGQLAKNVLATDLTSFEVKSLSWGSFVGNIHSGSISVGKVYAEELANGSEVALVIRDNKGVELANYYFKNCR
jgi:hypothetical protein